MPFPTPKIILEPCKSFFFLHLRVANGFIVAQMQQMTSSLNVSLPSFEVVVQFDRSQRTYFEQNPRKNTFFRHKCV